MTAATNALGVLLIAAGVLLLVSPRTSAQPRKPWRIHVARRTLVGLVAGALLALLTGWLAWVVALPVLATVVMPLFGKPEDPTEITSQINSWVGAIGAGVTAGQTLESAIIHSAENPPEGIQNYVQTAALQLRQGTPIEQVLSALRKELPESEYLAMTLAEAAKSRGHGLGAALHQLQTVAESNDSFVRDAIAAQQGPRAAARWIILIVLAMLVLFSRGPYFAFYLTPIGQLAAASLLAAFIAVAYTMTQALRFDPPTSLTPTRE